MNCYDYLTEDNAMPLKGQFSLPGNLICHLINEGYYLLLQLLATINIDGTTIHTAPNNALGKFGKTLPPPSGKMKSSLRNRLFDLKVIIIDEISMVSNDLLFHICLRLNEVRGSVKNEPFASICH